MTAAGAACVAYGVVLERRWYRLRHLAIPGALRTPGELTILHISDIHLSPGQDHRAAFLAELAGEHYDLVVATGDLLGDVGMEDATVGAMAPLTADGTPGLVVLGSNDLFGPTPKSPLLYFTSPGTRRYGHRHDTERMLRGLAALGYRTLRNDRTTVETAAGTVAVGGIDDPHLDPTRLPGRERIAVDAPDAALHLGLVHAPYRAALDLMVDAGHDLVLAGHTHGGQVRLPGIGALTANCDLPLDQARGLSRWGPSALHVSPGLGHSPYAPFRFACRPEATLLHLAGAS
ncbi:MAG: metallophosphoesterase [Actinobacteria bacterium]|nr:metallophosphoesterase [Actinomycetota bacterium]